MFRLGGTRVENRLRHGTRGQRKRTRLTAWGSALVLAAGLTAVAAPVAASAATQTAVSLTFDNGTISQYTLGYQQALQPHGAHASFLVNSGTVGASGNFISWAQLGTLAGAGNDIGGKTVSATNLTTDPNPTAQVCNDRTALLQHGLTPVAFAYPGGTQNSTVQNVVQSCGYGNGRTAGGLSPTGATYAETVPPANWFATRAYAPSAVTLANMESLVTGAASHGGGWDQIVIGKVCSQSLDPGNYSACSTSSGHIELSDLNSFLDWMANASQAGGAPAGATLATVRSVVTSADSSAPVTTIACNGAPCTSTPYSGVVSVTLAATDTGSGVASTHYTTDGSDPTQSSPTYTGAFNVNGTNSTTTVKFRSWDYAGNAEAVNTQVIQAPADTTPPTTTIACNGAACSSTPYVASVSVTLSATDTGGSGVDKIYYTTDGSTPTTSSAVYSGPFTLNTPATYNIQFFSADKAGNAEQVQSRQINVVPVTTKISLTFDNGTVSQYTLGYQQALQPHGAHATFFVNSGNTGVSANAMTWAQLGTLAGAGDDIGGKTVSATNLTTDPNPTSQVCDDRAALLQHGLTPVAFAYPGGAFNATVEGIVKSCGYGNARTAGSLSPAGPTYSETLPPKDWFATRAYAPTGQVTLANMEALVSGAAAHGGGWSQIVIGRVCSQAQDPASYSTCTASAGWIELADLNSFLDWMGNAGQSGGAPAGSALSTVRDAAISADTSAPVTTIACNGSPCSSSVYTSTVYVTLPSTDVGSAVASTHYTTDGSTPTLSSPAYTGAFPLTSSATVQYRSWDNAGNAEATKSQLVQVQQAPDSTPPTTTISCNGAACASTAYTAPITVTLTATDNPGGWGADKTYYTTDGSAPTTSSTVYTGPFTVKQNTTVSFFSTDLAGNAEQPNAQAIQFKTVVSLTFDDGDESQYSVGFLHGMQLRGMHGTFYIVNGYTDVNSGTMTWSQLTNLYNNSNDLGGHTVDHIDLTSSSYTQQQKTAEVCDNFQALTQHGLDPVSFAYPFGAYDTNAEQIVKSCGFSSARITGGIDRNGAGAGPVYAETIPPKDPYATRTVYNNGGSAPLTLSFLENSVTAAAQNGGGWAPLVFHEICSQTYDPANYSYCSSSWASIELDTFNAFLDWLQNAGQPGGAPASTVVQTVRQVINGPDQTRPATTISCDGSPCQTTTYNGSTTVALSAADKGGSGVKATYYTTDGSAPTTSSAVYSGAFTITQPTTVKFFSVDNAGNAEAAQTQQIQVAPNPDPVIGAAGDIACDPSQAAFNDGLGTATDCRALYTGKLLTGVDAVLPLGDVQYNCGGTAAFQQSYGPAWGPKLAITHPVPGGSDYKTSGGTDCPTTAGAGYYSYFGSSAGDPAKGYYSYNLGQWHIVALNTGPCENGDASFCAAGSAQDQWLQNDLANNTASCTLAYYQNPRWASAASGSGGDGTYQQLWQDLYAGGADAALNGDSHWYERFAPLNASGAIDNNYGVREFIVGTGGQGLDTPGTEVPTSQVLNNTTHGIIKMTLHNGSYDWQFLNDGESSFTDSGSASCHGRPDRTPPTTTMSVNGATPSAGWYNAPVNVTLTATDNQGGSGVSATYYTTDGSTPTTSSTKYTGPFTVSSTSTVKFFSVDNAGNTEPVQSQQVQIDTSPPGTTISCNGAPCSAGWYNAAVKVTLSAADTGGSGVNSTFYTTDGSDPTTSPTATLYTGSFTVPASATVKYYSTDLAGNFESVNSQQIQINTTAPTTTISCNGAACSGWYNAVTVTLTAADPGGSGVANTYYTTDGSTPTTSSTVYTGAFTVPATSTVKFFSTDNAGNTEAVNSQQIQIDTSPPGTTISCNGAPCSAGWYNASVKVTLAATDPGGSGVNSILYTTDGSDPATSPTVTLYTGAFTVPATATVKFFSVDNAGNAEQVNSQQIQIDTAAPGTTISCNGAPCSAGWYNASVKVTLVPADAGGSGVSKTYYTTDGSTPTTSSTVYTGAVTVPATSTVKFFSTDNAGNTEAVNSQQIQIDTTAPSTTISCNGAPCSTGWYNASVKVTLAATDNSGGSGVGYTLYTTDGSNPATSPTATLYTGAFTVPATATVKYYSTDNAGNSEAVKSQQIQIDTTAPTTTASCNGGACSTGWYNASVKVTLSATDNSGGSGVSKTYYTTDGSTPTTSSTAYTGVFTAPKTATVKFFSVDNVGNSEAVKSQLIQIDTTAPGTTITCNSAACSTGWYKTTPVTAGLSATDNTGGSGVKATLYTTDGSNPQTSNTAILYTGPFTISQTTTVKYYSFDNAGNNEPVKSQLIQIDAAAPTVSITAPVSGSSFAQGTKISVTATAADLGTGSAAPSGIASVTFYLDGTTVLATVTSSPYSFSWNTNKIAKGTHKLTAVATDVAGNSTTSAAITISIT